MVSDPQDVVFVVLSQGNYYHTRLANDLKSDLYTQSLELAQVEPVVYLTHKDFQHPGSWTVIPLIPDLVQAHRTSKKWIIFVEDRTKINFRLLLITLAQYNYKQDWFLGHAVYDHEPTIIHHFSYSQNPLEQFPYPNFASGLAISISLLKKLAQFQDQKQSDFHIDNAYELAIFIRNQGGTLLTHVSNFCTAGNNLQLENCATSVVPFQKCGRIRNKESIYFGVKTCRKFHKDRVVDVVKRTWGQYTKWIFFYSDIADNTIPTIPVVNVPNVDRGHCNKTLWILRHYVETSTLPWLAVIDDDTILGVAQLHDLVQCLRQNETVLLGERYGYNLQNSRGYNYVTGGGGMVLSRPLVKRLLAATNHCRCPSLDAPDDMQLGICTARLHPSALIHSPLFHQARPEDYPSEYLRTNDSVSFHKHWQTDPIEIYDKWFRENDENYHTQIHNEL